MKNVFLSTIFLSYMSVSLLSQGSLESPELQNEIRVNVLYAVGSMIDISYEKAYKEKYGLGIMVVRAWSTGVPYQWGIAPFVRLYSNARTKETKYAVFFEINTALFELEEDEEGSERIFGMGAALGFKFFNSDDVVGELVLGGGRGYFQKVQVYPRMAVSLGKRF